MRFKKLLYRAGWLVLAFLGVLALAAGLKSDPVGEGLSPTRVTLLDNQWEAPLQEESGWTQYRYLISQGGGGSLCLYMKTYLTQFEVLLDGEVVHSFSSPSDKGVRSQHVVQLSPNADGKVLAVRFGTADASSTQKKQVGSAYLGDVDALFSRLLLDNLYALIFLIFAVLAGAMLLIVAFWTRKSFFGALSGSLLNLSAFALITGVWVLTDSDLLLFWTNKTAAISLISFVSFMLMPIFLLRFLNYILGESRPLRVMCRLFAVIAALYLANYLVQAVPGYVLLFPTHLLIVASIVHVIKDGAKRLMQRNDKVIRRIMEGFGVLSVFCVVALILFWVDPLSQYSFMYCAGILFFILCLVSAQFSRLYEQMEENANTAAYRRLAYLDGMTGLGNRTAFIEEQEKDDPLAGVTYILFDINNLKQVNDQYGHQEGDLLICAVAKCIQDVFGESGKCYRIGGDEFVVILKDSCASDTAEKLDAMSARVAQENEKRMIPVSIAAGCAVWQEKETASQLYQRADADMYQKKLKMKAEAED